MKRFVLLLSLLTFVISVHADLDEIPGPELTQEGLPAPARWLALRYDQPPLRLLAICTKSEMRSPYERIARRLRASLDVRYTSPTNGDMINHINDKWIEASNHPTAEELGRAVRQSVIDTFDANGHAPYDVVLT